MQPNARTAPAQASHAADTIPEDAQHYDGPQAAADPSEDKMPKTTQKAVTTIDDLESRIGSVLPALTQKQHRLARTLLGDPMLLAFASAEDVGRMADVDSATVVRFSRLLGYEGFADLRDSIRKSVPQFLTEIERVGRILDTTPSAYESPSDVCAQDIRNIEEAARANTTETFQAAIEALSRAERVFCLAQGISRVPADYLAHQLTLIGLDSRRSPRSELEAAILFPTITARDVVVVFSVWRYLAETENLTRAVRDSGATVISIVDSRAAPVAALSDHSLVAGTVTPKLGHSMTAMSTMANVLATGVANANPERALERLTRIEDYYSRGDVIASNATR
jgi:DNA-binding MurR/RpiR family transcriptional regulator